FEPAHGLFHWSLVFKGESALDVTQLLRYFSHIDLDILKMFPGLYRGVAGFLRVGDDVIDGCARLFNVACAVEFVRIVKLLLCDPHAQVGTILGMSTFEARFECRYSFVFGRAVGEAEHDEENGESNSSHGSQRFFGSMAIRRWVACHS